jgi:hypothetical protein
MISPPAHGLASHDQGLGPGLWSNMARGLWDWISIDHTRA